MHIRDIEGIINAVSKGKIDWIDLVMHIGALIQDIPDALKNCKDLPSKIVETFKAWGKKIINPYELIKIIANATIYYFSRLVDDVKGFLENWENKQFKASGEKLGDIPYVLFTKCDIYDTIPENATLVTLISN